MFLNRKKVKLKFIKELNQLKNQVIILRGARQVGKTTFLNDILNEFKDYNIIKCNFLFNNQVNINNEIIQGRNFFGTDVSGDDFIKNIQNKIKKNIKTIVFIDESDQFPICLESIQHLAMHSKNIKFIFTGSNLENISLKNASTGRNNYFDLYPFSFVEYLENHSNNELIKVYNKISFNDLKITEFYHSIFMKEFYIYLRLGGMPIILKNYFTSNLDQIPKEMSNLIQSIEDNIKDIIHDKAVLYEYINILKKIALLSMNSLKITKIQTNNTSRKDAIQILHKAIGARVVHKVSFFNKNDLSKYILFDSGIVNSLINSFELLNSNISNKHLALMLETAIGNELIQQLTSRDELNYWKSENKAEIEFTFNNFMHVGIDVKKTYTKKINSLNSFAINEDTANLIVLISDCLPEYKKQHISKLPNYKKTKEVKFLKIPFYLTPKLIQITKEISKK